MYKQHTLRYEFENYSGSFDDNGNTSLTISDIKSMCRVSYFGNVGGFQCEVSLFGLGLELVAMLSAKGIGPYTDQNARIGMKIIADETEVFSGSITSVYANMNTVPDVALIITAVAGGDLMRSTAKPFSQEGTIPCKSVLAAICSSVGYNLRTSGIDSVNVTNPHYTGGPLDQIKQLCTGAEFFFAINGKDVVVWKPGEKTDDIIPIVSADYGLIGYPVFTPSGITFQTQFSTYLAQGRYAKLETILPNASGTYQLFAVDHYLSSWMKDGPWLTISQGSKVQDGNNQQ